LGLTFSSSSLQEQEEKMSLVLTVIQVFPFNIITCLLGHSKYLQPLPKKLKHLISLEDLLFSFSFILYYFFEGFILYFYHKFVSSCG